MALIDMLLYVLPSHWQHVSSLCRCLAIFCDCSSLSVVVLTCHPASLPVVQPPVRALAVPASCAFCCFDAVVERTFVTLCLLFSCAASVFNGHCNFDHVDIRRATYFWNAVVLYSPSRVWYLLGRNDPFYAYWFPVQHQFSMGTTVSVSITVYMQECYACQQVRYMYTKDVF